MRRFLQLSIVLFALSLISSCDKIEPPYTQIVEEEPDDELTRKVLLEDYTGQRCVNCPAAAKVAHDIKELYGSKVVLMGIHTGFFALPGPPVFMLDLRTEAGEAWDNHFGISTAGHPKGVINRTSKSGVYFLSPGEWSTETAAIIDDKANIKIGLMTEYDENSRKLNISVSSTFLRTLGGAYTVQVCLVEDSLVGTQFNNDATIGPAVIENYVHRHVLRGAVNGIWGEPLTGESGAVVGAVIDKTYEINLNADWKAHHVSVVVWVQRASDLELLQVEEVQIVQ